MVTETDFQGPAEATGKVLVTRSGQKRGGKAQSTVLLLGTNQANNKQELLDSSRKDKTSSLSDRRPINYYH